ncbi:MAG: hypothetical protein K6C09_04520 [Oscillospiraceae bacterium]|nr:hypothetical protein [Oscillospiraceae bacterium]
MDAFIRYMTDQIEAGKAEIARLGNDGCQDDADFAKVRTNIYEVCNTVTDALIRRPGAGTEAIRAQFERFHTTWGAAFDSAREHNDTRNIVIGEIKLQALEDVTAHFAEAVK